MPRKARNLESLKFYHVMVQGLNKEYIFDDDKHKKKYLYILKKYLDLYQVKLVAYCVMSNHCHLLLYSEDDHSISEMMHKINLIFSKYYNVIKNRVGYVFRDRFLSQEIYDYNQLKVCIHYIHNNPIKAKMVRSPELYYFSSFNSYKSKESIFVDFDLISIFFKNNNVADIFDFEDDDHFVLKEMNYYDKALYFSEVVNKIDVRKIVKNKELLKKFLIVSKEQYFVPNTELAKVLDVTHRTVCFWVADLKLNFD